ncbi:TetR/AcrR family transcriptional regulator [Dethiosulfatarculus sandiegensis]|uniref:HTH tetR-type domain-containing protein n=1 Tax=Dethiosulfatarculus sandiegensis TaxID=1429043 RepID=A0A0D2J2W4_9BACT|nr:TetR/AcrR family transcriptional regulator [Dethiosulfatarculus sandiegensis]KIX12494.1 hypothetical protein X474_18720 [Dethiosulfatarculus sandiegensis]
MPSNEKKEKILQAARVCIERYGTQKTTLEDIGQMVGLNKASLYYYFPCKEAILMEAALFECEQFLTHLRQMVSRCENSIETVRTYLEERCDYYQKMIIKHIVSVEDLLRGIPQFELLYKDSLEREIEFLGSVLKKGVQAGQIKEYPCHKVARAILVAVTGIERHYIKKTQLSELSKIDFDQIKKEVLLVVDLILNGLQKH